MTKQKRKTCLNCGRKLVISKMVKVRNRENRWTWSDRDMSHFVCKKCLCSWKKQHKKDSWWDWPEINRVSSEISKDTEKNPKKIKKVS